MQPGLSAQVTLTVSGGDTAIALRSGDVAVLATPRAVALAEEATVAAIAEQLPAGRTSVGTRVELDHLAATPIGRTVLARATLVAVDGRRLRFEVRLHEGEGVIATGVVERIVVDRDRFLANASG